jgi:hypothetical protein
MKAMRTSVFCAFCLSALSAAGASAQPIPPAPQQNKLDVKTINFDLWCQETQRLPPDRCDKRLPQDEKDFESYRSKVEKYEVPYLEEKQSEGTLNRVIIHSNPQENPVDHPGQQPSPNP